MIKEISKLDNNINYIYKQNKNTPRTVLCLNFSINKAEEKPGIYSLIARLLIQGTKNYNSEELANEFEKYAIDFSCVFFEDYFRLKFVCLNEDFPKAIELFHDIIVNSTFDEIEKEKIKLSGEITAELDSPRETAVEAFLKNIFKNHYYGNTATKILQSLDTITKDDVIQAYKNILTTSKKSLSVVGALEKDDVIPVIQKTLGTIPASAESEYLIEKPVLSSPERIENIRRNLNQAHIIKGWTVPTYNSDEYYTLILLNIILGASGLSSRLFTELRDKKGLAYVVRSSYDIYKLAGTFSIYIATEPKNIETCLKGFEEEIEKIKTIPVSEKELEDAKNHLIGSYAFFNETNEQQASSYAKFDVLNLGFDFLEKIKENIRTVTCEQILTCAKKHLNDNYVISIIKP